MGLKAQGSLWVVSHLGHVVCHVCAYIRLTHAAFCVLGMVVSLDYATVQTAFAELLWPCHHLLARMQVSEAQSAG